MEKEELLLHGKTKMKGHVYHDDDDDVELFSRKRSPNQRRALECCTGFLVILCLTFFATTIIFGVRYLSVSHSLYVLQQENTHKARVIPIQHTSASSEGDNEEFESYRNRISELENELGECRNNVQQLLQQTPAGGGSNPGFSITPSSQLNNASNSQKLCNTENMGNSAKTTKFYWFDFILLALPYTFLQCCLIR